MKKIIRIITLLVQDATQKFEFDQWENTSLFPAQSAEPTTSPPKKATS